MTSSNLPVGYAAGTESRDWIGVHEPPQSVDLSGVRSEEIEIPMRDGVRLAAVRLYGDGDEPCPAIVVTNGYAAMDEFFFPPFQELAANGYEVVVARLRGVPPSGGKAGLYEKYGPDGYDVIEWVAAQPYCNGRVGMVGASLLGVSQWFAAREQPPHLEVLVPDDAPNDTYRYLWYVGDANPGPGRQGRSAIPGVESEYDLAIAHPEFDEFWHERSVTAEQIREIAGRGMPALLSSGWESYVLDAASRAYTWMREADAGDRARLIIGPWAHGAMFSTVGRFDQAPFGDLLAPRRAFDVQRMWLDHWLRDRETELESTPPVQIFVQGPDRWRYENDWPLPDERRVTLALTDGPSETVDSLNDGRLAAGASDAGSVDYRFEPGIDANPVAVSTPQMVLDEDGAPQPAVEVFPDGATRPRGRLRMDRTRYLTRALTWTGPVLSEACEITGYPVLVLRARVSSSRALFVAELHDVSPDGDSWTSEQITAGYRQAGSAPPTSDGQRVTGRDPESGRDVRIDFGDAHPESDDVREYRIELSPTSFVVPAGHRVRVVLQGAPIDPAYALTWQGPPMPEEPFTIDAASGSRVELPIIGTVPAAFS